MHFYSCVTILKKVAQWLAFVKVILPILRFSLKASKKLLDTIFASS
jgi:hypothetical protein